MGDYGAATPWSDSSVKGCKKFLDRVAGLTDILSEEPVSEELEMKDVYKRQSYHWSGAFKSHSS